MHVVHTLALYYLIGTFLVKILDFILFSYNLQLSSVESLCIPPYARDSHLGKAALELLHNAENTDMVFEILTYSGKYWCHLVKIV